MTDSELKKKLKLYFGASKCENCGKVGGAMTLERDWGWICEDCKFEE